MKTPIFWMALVLIASCHNSYREDPIAPDTEAELQSIEITRNGFTQAIKEKRYKDLSQWTAADVFTIGPGGEAWENMYASRSALGLFPYDSIIMSPKETVILNDSIAYDFGTSRVYYADSLGRVHQLKDSYLALLKKDSTGRWRLFREVASSNIPLGN